MRPPFGNHRFATTPNVMRTLRGMPYRMNFPAILEEKNAPKRTIATQLQIHISKFAEACVLENSFVARSDTLIRLMTGYCIKRAHTNTLRLRLLMISLLKTRLKTRSMTRLSITLPPMRGIRPMRQKMPVAFMR